MTEDLSQSLSRIEKNFLDRAAPEENPVLLHMLGIPGAGKTTFLNLLFEKWSKTRPISPTLLGFDQVMQQIPAYQQTPDKIVAFSTYELPARDAGYKIFNRLMEKKASILFDNGGSAATHPELLRVARDVHGYRIAIVEIAVPLAEARARIDTRSVVEGQHTPAVYLEDRAQKLSKLREEYMAITPYFYHIQNDDNAYQDFIKKCLECVDCLFHDLFIDPIGNRTELQLC